ncbi:MAG: acetyl-CoA carboxylase biotin carboxyl carrier protein [Pedosphaera sp.]|nr:acetyl-CoA carboxylase biotin carboxyl carrier protein [Pedosphaera sp.]
MDLKDIKGLIDLMRKNSLSEFELEKEGFKIRLKRGVGGAMTSVMEDAPMGSYASAPTLSATPSAYIAAASAHAAPPGTDSAIKSPMIGTLYRSPSPESAPYVEIGQQVNPDTVVCIIEAMKVMNEIKAEVKGVITHIEAENTKPVEFGQVLFRVRPN